MTYKLHSDIVWNYGEVIDKVTGAVIAPNVNIQWREIDENFEGFSEICLKIQTKKNQSVHIQMTNSWA